jgi:hypothetical protein
MAKLWIPKGLFLFPPNLLRMWVRDNALPHLKGADLIQICKDFDLPVPDTSKPKSASKPRRRTRK